MPKVELYFSVTSYSYSNSTINCNLNAGPRKVILVDEVYAYMNKNSNVISCTC